MSVEEIGVPLGGAEEAEVRKDAPGAEGAAQKAGFVQPGETGDPMLEHALELGLAQLSEEDKEKLSKVLFPDTHTDTVLVLGKERTLRPTSLKTSRQIYSLTKNVQEKIKQQTEVSGENLFASVDAVAEEFSDVVVKTLISVAKCLCDYYGEEWNDIKVAAADEDISFAELQAIVQIQQALNTANDFFLQPLRAFVRLLQMREVSMVLLEKSAIMSTLRL